MPTAIESFIQKDNCGGNGPMMHDIFGVHIKVNKNKVEEALSIVGEVHSDKKVIESTPPKSLMPFWILVFLSVGTGLFWRIMGTYLVFKMCGSDRVVLL